VKIIPRPYQTLAVRAALKGLQGLQKRALVVLATGLGKTLTAAFITRELRPRRVLFLVHNNFILKHAVDEFRLVFGERTKMAVFNGLFKGGAQEADMVFATWQTMSGNLKLWKRNHFDLIVVDEAHHTEADTYRPVVDYFVGSRLGITATPDRADECDIRDVFGTEVVNITLEEAIARGWLPRVEYHVVTDESLDEGALQKIAMEIREGKKRFTMAEVNRRIFIRKRDKQIAQIIDGYDEKSVVFCANIRHAERMSRSLRLSATFHSETAGTQKATWTQNQKTLDALRNGSVRRICAVNAFNEGVNVPTVGLVAFCRVTGSLTIFRQQLGRGLRPGKDKLVVLDFVGNLERIQLLLQIMNRISDLHERYTDESERDREGYERGSFEVSGQGFEFTFSDRIVDLMKVLEYCEAEFYETWQEAAKAASLLGIRSKAEYATSYRKDPRLPSSPPYTYGEDFPTWEVFLGRRRAERYKTWREASKAALALGITSPKEYKARYKEDPRLPADPPSMPGCLGWNAFFGRERKLYPTWQKVLQICKQHKVRSVAEYHKLCDKDPRLPRFPYDAYEGFPGFAAAFGRRRIDNPYPTWQQASKAAKRLGIKSSVQYPKLFKRDKRLYASPSMAYSDFPGWAIFLGIPERKLVQNPYSTWQQAGRAARALGIKGSMEYRRRYKEDERLPGVPHRYEGFPGWAKFLKKT
jgi:superfamily II DNA or RNA helicase